MAIVGSTQFLERIQFFNGERLFASDLQALEAFNREMRWLHNQSLHQPGVGSGFQVLGNTGDRQVTISPGYALDSCGREIILTENRILAIPPVADDGSGGSVFYDLTVSYPNDSDLTPSETRDGICMPAGVVRLREEPVLCWARLSDDLSNRQPVDARLKNWIKTGLFIVLAQVEIFHCQLKHPVSTVQRRNARPAKQPRIACGSFAPTPQQWRVAGLGNASLSSQMDFSTGELTSSSVRVYVDVDTSPGHFGATPAYNARLSGKRINNDRKGNYWILDGLVDVAESPAPTPTSFRIEIFPVILPLRQRQTSASVSVHQSLFHGWQINWMGIES